MDLTVDRGLTSNPAPKRCPFCHDTIVDHPKNAQCETCGAWHHGDCWDTHKKCSSCGHSEKVPTPGAGSLAPKKRCLELGCERSALNDARYPKYSSLCKAHGYILWKRQHQHKHAKYQPLAFLCLSLCFLAAWFAVRNPLPLGCSVFFAIATLAVYFDDTSSPWTIEVSPGDKIKDNENTGKPNAPSRASRCGSCGDPILSGEETQACEQCKTIHHTDCRSALNACPECNLDKARKRPSMETLRQAQRNQTKTPGICEIAGCVNPRIPWDGRSMYLNKCEDHAEDHWKQMAQFFGAALLAIPIMTVAVALIAYFASPKPTRASFFMVLGGALLWGFLFFLKSVYKAPVKDSERQSPRSQKRGPLKSDKPGLE
ncbi:MAG: hypothetical protein P1V97_21455 [Planctomycetota bacterium]|nr:hypothetical protein [Planctomycetota bacterium]